MDSVFVDFLVVFFALVFYTFLIVVYVLRSRQLEETELKLSLPFSFQIIPFTLLLLLNFLIGNDSGRLVVELPIIISIL